MSNDWWVVKQANFCAEVGPDRTVTKLCACCLNLIDGGMAAFSTGDEGSASIKK